MNQGHEETHYQIALTNRQVLIAFGSLLGCLFVAFFAGIWIGRGATAPPTSSTGEGAAAEVDAAADGFEFFSRTIPLQSANLDAPVSLAASPPPPQAMEGQERTSQSAGIESLDRSRTSDQAVIQVFSSPDQAQAIVLVDRLLGAGYTAFLSAIEIDGQQHYRVRIGPFRNRDHARRRASDLERELGLETWIPSTLD